MTTILADAKKGVMVCDSKATFGGEWFPVKKVFRHGDELFGFAGTQSEGVRWLDWYSTGQRGKMPSISNVSIMILGAESGVRLVEGSGSLFSVERSFYAIGSGATAARGAHMAGADAKKAVEIACKIDAGSGGDVIVHRLKA
jgi:ATP-dependent protease HslVU (ClpYQ) peptidase subunit